MILKLLQALILEKVGMKAILLKAFGGTENFSFENIEDPQVSDNDVLVKIKAASFNPIDFQMRRGATESKLLKSAILGRELSGEVISIGKNVTKFFPGDRVAAYIGSFASNGAYAELISIPEELLARIPDKLDYAEGAALPMVGMTALQCFNRMQIPLDKTVFISGGAGGVGSFLIKLLMASGHRKIFTTAGNDESINYLLSLGLIKENIINYNENNIVAALGEGSFDYVIDIVGGRMSEVCAELISVYGTFADITFLVTERARELLFDKATTTLSIANFANASKKGEDRLAFYGKTLAQLFQMIESDQITPGIIEIVGNFNLQSVAKAHELLENNLTRGKKLVMLINQ